jgi:hypothetical protein
MESNRSELHSNFTACGVEWCVLCDAWVLAHLCLVHVLWREPRCVEHGLRSTLRFGLRHPGRHLRVRERARVSQRDSTRSKTAIKRCEVEHRHVDVPLGVCAHVCMVREKNELDKERNHHEGHESVCLPVHNSTQCYLLR